MKIDALTNADPRFYPLLGPYLSNRAVVRELGAPVYDDAGKVWFVVLGEAGELRGFAAMLPRGRKVVLCSAYVLPAHRKQGVYRALLTTRLDWALPNTALWARATAASRPALLAAAFTCEGVRGRYYTMTRGR